MPDDIHELAAALDQSARIRGEFTLRSGLTTNEYFDKYRFEADPLLLRQVAEHMVALLPADTEILGGLELGGVPIATLVSSLTGLPALFVRKEAKKYGTCKLAEGGDFAGRTITLIEDIVTTGGAVRNAALALRGLDATVHTVVCAIDRSEPGANTLHEIDLTTVAVLTKKDLDTSTTRASGSV
ncbi:orotate phosphoribosyltransferase [Leekyejoonella antrihumi]|uniref:Orotate phosphoribosyltransferase n=1 Tax=Leekyejoonella antrihumi TaxID=1660198 RepID=A0A563E412_9MICO|nr:orotate phosphoribosyltransferase [Leekyejoonella antrihumi]TWP36972.1 orotate phosphoribosyltransferase [Leekyejoonella antrihumi]